jgi:YbbR domain-containing protein
LSEHTKEPVNWQKGKQLLARITEKWPVKVLSIVAAIILFVFHRLGNIQERFFSVPLQLEISNNLVPSSSYPRNVRVTLRGDANSIYPVVEEDIEAYLDLTRYNEPGSFKAAIQIRKKGTALEVENLEIIVEPMEILVDLDTKLSKYVPIAPNFEGSPEKGYELVSYILEPNQMVIDGPLNLINSVAELNTDSIDLQSRNEDFVVHLKIVNPNPLVVIRGDGMTEFRGFIRESIMIRSFDDIPISVTGLSGGFLTAETGFGSLRLEGAQRLVEVFEPQENTLSVDASDISAPGLYVLPVKASIPEAFTLSRQEPLEITLRIVEAEEQAGENQ